MLCAIGRAKKRAEETEGVGAIDCARGGVEHLGTLFQERLKFGRVFP